MIFDGTYNLLIKSLKKQRDNYSYNKKILYSEDQIRNIYDNIIAEIEGANTSGYLDVEEYYEEFWHFKRTCEYCGYIWHALHCPHDGYQNPCPECGKRPTVIGTDDLCDCEFDC